MSRSDSQSDDFDIIERQEADLDPETLQRVQKWLQPTDYMAESSEFRRHLSSQTPGTGLWICDTVGFGQWHDSADHGSLWIKGVPGAGKSVIAASIADHLMTKYNVPVLFFFFRYIIAANRKPRSLIRDWLAQLLPHSLRLQASLLPMLECEIDDLSDERLWEHLLIGLSSIEKAYCIVDALDEMELLENDSFLVRLNSLASFRPECIKLLMTSRPKQYLQSKIRDASIVHISLEDDLVGNDIALFVLHRLKTAIPDDASADLRESLLSTICTRSGGLFLYARLLLDQIIPTLRSERNIDVKTFADSLPVGLENMYNSMLHQQAQTLKIEIAIQVFLLEIATHSSRSLRLNELANLLEFKFPSSIITGTSKAIARSACAPLLEILEDETVQVIHHSFTEFLLDLKRGRTSPKENDCQFPILESENIHKRLAIQCLNYLQSGVLRSKEGVSKEKKLPCDGEYTELEDENDTYDYQQARLRHPSLEYTIQNWGYHASKYDVEDDEFFFSIRTFVAAEFEFRRWLSLANAAKCLSPKSQAPSLLHVAAFAGLTKFAAVLFQEGHEVDCLDDDQKTPLLWASDRGHTAMVSLLLGAGADPDPEDHLGVKPIHLAARKNQSTIVKLLLEAGVNPLSPKTKEWRKSGYGRMLGGQRRTKGDTAVQYVCQQGHTDTIVVMLPFLRPETLIEVLCETCRYGKFEAARAALKNSNVSVNSKFAGATALYFACLDESVECVKLLLGRGADIHLTSEWDPLPRIYGGRGRQKGPSETPLQGLVRHWDGANHNRCEEIFQLLVRAGADIKEKDSKGETALMSMFQERSCPSIKPARVLLEAGADISDTFADEETILHRYLAWNRDIEMVDLLLHHGADINASTRHGCQPLHEVLRAYSTNSKKSTVYDMIEYLLRKGAHASSAMSAATCSRNCDIETFRLLLQACPDESIRSQCLWRVGEKYGDEKIKFIRELLSVGVSLESRNARHETVLLTSIRSQNTWKVLVECGAKLDVVDASGRGALHHYVTSSSSPLEVQELIDVGLDPRNADGDGKTILHIAASQYQGTPNEVKLINYLLSLGLSVNTKDKEGLTPLHINIESTNGLPKSSFFDNSSRVPLLSLFQNSAEPLNVNAQDKEGLTVLHLAAMRSEIDVARLLEVGANPKIVTKDERTALHLACRARRSDIVGLLLQKVDNELVHRRDTFGRTALHDACSSGQPESVHLLLRSGANINEKDSNGRSPLHACAEFVAEQNRWFLLQRRNTGAGPTAIDRYRPSPIWSGNSQPWYSSEYITSPSFSTYDTAGISGIVKLLLDAGADSTAIDLDELSALELALSCGCNEMVESLQFSAAAVQKRWGLKPEDARFQTEVALKQRVSIRNFDLPEASREELLKHPARYLTTFMCKDIDWMIQNGANFTGEADYSEESFLHAVAGAGFTQIMESLGTLARFYDHTDTVKSRLVNAGYSNHYVNDFAPVLLTACRRSMPNMQMLQVLVEKCGVDVNSHALAITKQWANADTGVEGPSALHCLSEAEYHWQLGAIRYLVARGADIDSRDENGETALHIACGGPASVDINHVRRPSFWGPECVQLLLDLGADPNALDNHKLSPLHKARSSPKSLEILLQRGADLSIGSSSPLFAAIQSQDLQALRILLDAGASPNTKDISKSFNIHYDVKDQDRPALFCASFPYTINQDIKNSAPLVKLLINRGANLYAPLNDHETLIHYVFQYAEYEIVCAFLECGEIMDFNAKDQLGRTVFIAACNWMLSLPGYREKHWFGKEKAPVLQMLRYGPDPLAIDDEMRNALHHLLDNPDMEQDAILQFLENDACKEMLTQTDRKGFSPLNCSLRILRPRLVEVLLAMGTDLLLPDPKGATALHHIALQCLLIHKPQRRKWLQRDQDEGYYESCLQIWHRFLALGGDINVRDNKGDPPLFWYLSVCNKTEYEESYTELFLNADVHARNADGESALHVISGRDDQYSKTCGKKLFDFMVKKGLDPLTEDKWGRSSLDVAAAFGKQEILDLFQYRS